LTNFAPHEFPSEDKKCIFLQNMYDFTSSFFETMISSFKKNNFILLFQETIISLLSLFKKDNFLLLFFRIMISLLLLFQKDN